MPANKSGTTHEADLINKPPGAVSLYTVARQLLALQVHLKKQERWCKRQLPTLLGDMSPNYRDVLSPKDIKRITKYYQLSLNIICGNLYYLTGHKLQQDEHKRIILLSVFLPLLDDLFDDRLMRYEDITSLITTPENFVPTSATDHLVQDLYLALLRLTPRRTLFVEHLQQVSHWENESLKQFSNNISKEALYQITYNKSYYSVLLFCAVLNHYPGPAIEQMLYPIAGLMQLTNDAFDVWKDLQQGLYTLPNRYCEYEQLQELFMKETISINHQLSQLPYALKARQTYAIKIHALHAMGWMSLEQLKGVTAGSSDPAVLVRLSRRDLVCDMDSLTRQIKWVKHIKRFTNYYGPPSGKVHERRYTPVNEQL